MSTKWVNTGFQPDSYRMVFRRSLTFPEIGYIYIFVLDVRDHGFHLYGPSSKNGFYTKLWGRSHEAYIKETSQ